MEDKVIVSVGPAVSGPRFALLDPQDRAEIEGLVAAYGRYYDDGAIDDFVGLIADDACFYPNWPGVAPEEVSGIEALRAFFTAARGQCDGTGPRPFHLATNVLIPRATATTAEVSVTMLYTEVLPGGAPEVKMVGQYDYHVEKRNGRWFIVRWSMRYVK